MEKESTGINVDVITFNEKGEMIVLDQGTLDLISGGGSTPTPTPAPPPPPPPTNSGFICGSINVSPGCGPTVNVPCNKVASTPNGGTTSMES